ncbi:MAG: hypothetical protein M0Q38_00650 [Bacteroidales bacterium]|nr:hypothetical protein [Bacteroidales bacterium]
MIPLFQLLKIGRFISYDQAAEIIGDHFIDIQDKLINTLQLIRQQKTDSEHSSLLEASIDQKINRLKIFHFTTAINLRKNLKYLKYVSIPLLVLLLLAILSPQTISDPTRRIIRFNQTFERSVPFRIEIINKQLSVMQQEDFELKIKLTGEEIPTEIFIQTGGVTYKMRKNKGFIYSYLFKSLQSDVVFKFLAGAFLSEEFELKVYPKPIILNFGIKVDFPGYINKPPETYENTGDMIVPEGSKLSWTFYTKDVNEISLHFLNERISLQKQETNKFTYFRKFFTTTPYSIIPRNKYTFNVDSLLFKISVINDGFPSISVSETVDTIIKTSLFFKGTIKDDYGFSKLTFNYSTNTEKDTIKHSFNSIIIPIVTSINTQNFYYATNLSQLIKDNGDKITYYFEVWDNDGINGPKSTRSELRTLSTPTLNEIESHTDNNGEKIEDALETSVHESESIKQTMEDLNRKMTEKNVLSWQEKKKVEELIKSNENILKNIEEIKNRNLENIQNEEEYLNTSERILEKQKQLNKLMDQLLTDEMRKIMQEMKKLLDQIDKNKLGDLMEKMKTNNKDLESQLDRNLELFKQIEFDRKVENLINTLKRNAEEQEKLADQTEKKQDTDTQMKAEQKEIKNSSDSVSKSLKQLSKDSQNLESKPDMSKARQKQDSITKKLERIEKQLEGKSAGKISKEQKEAANEMKELAMQMEESMQETEEEQLEEDASKIRMILENLIRLSYEQEDLIKNTRLIARNDPKYTEIVESQKEMSDKLRGVEDSLNAIAKRQIIIQPIITREVASINQNILSALESMNNRTPSNAVSQQQFAMTSINNLALLLNESLEKMNQQMSMSMMGKGKKKSCQKPSNSSGKGSMKNLKSMQQKLGEQLQQIKDGIEKMKNEGKGNKSGQSEMNKQIAKMAAEQEALRNEMQKYRDDLLEQGLKDGGSIKQALKEMEQNETDIINKQITQETLQRQKQIVSRMLESEKAEQMRDKEEKRESTESKNQKFSNPLSDFKYKIKLRSDQELLQFTPPALNGFYKDKVNNYIIKIEN